MKSEMEFNKEKKRALGAFYTPQVLLDLLASLLVPLSKVTSTSSIITALDPATGDSILLESFEKLAQKKGIDVSLVGIDVDETAINKSKKKFEHCYISLKLPKQRVNPIYAKLCPRFRLKL